MNHMHLPDPDQYQLFIGQAARADAASPSTSTSQSAGAAGLNWVPDQLLDVSNLNAGSTTLRMCVLGSGSGGNCTAVEYAGRLLLIDAGFGPRSMTSRLHERGAVLSQVRGICLTHLDSDHFRPNLIPTLIRWRISIYLYENHLPRFWRLEKARELYDAGLVKVFTSRQFSPLDGLEIQMVKLAHDATGTCAFRMQSDAGSIGYATDLGQVPEQLVSHFSEVDLLAIESNYDPQMQRASNRPLFLKERIMGGAGHLSNDQCMAAIEQVIARSSVGGPCDVVLLHRSRQCNCPNLIKSLYAGKAGFSARLTLSDQDAPSPWLTVGRG